MRRKTAVVACVLSLGISHSTDAGAPLATAECSDRFRPPLRAALAATSPTAVLIRERVRAEVSEIWLRHGVPIAWVDPNGLAAGDADILRIVVQDEDLSERSRASASAVAWIGFSNGRPHRILRASTHAALLLLSRSAPVDEVLRRPDQLIQLARYQRLLARFVAWAVAHELGHYVLASASHDAEGLMRPAIRPAELTDPRPDLTTLAPLSRRVLVKRLEPCDVVAKKP